jgi:hypothetical protein
MFKFKFPFVIDHLDRTRFGRWVMERFPIKYHYPFILVAGDRKNVSNTLWKHELIHHYQVLRDGWFKFNYRYIRQLRTVGYMRIDYEVEAYMLMHDPLTDAEKAYVRVKA